MNRVVFMGTPEFAVPTLRALLDHPDFAVVGVVTQPDRPAGRGQEAHPSPVKRVAMAAGVPVFQPEKLRTPEAFTQLRAWAPDLIIVAAFGQILRQNVLDLPPKGCINVHASLLPRWRGAAPIPAAIRAGDAQSGITIMQMDAGMDTGPILAQRSIPLDPRETGQSLHDKLALLGGELLLETLPAYLAGQIRPRPQPEDPTLITYAPPLKKEEGLIDWTRSAAEIDRLVLAFTPWPGTFTYWNGRLLKVLSGTPADGALEPGRVVRQGTGLAVGTGAGVFVVERLQLEGRKAVSAEEFVRGQPAIVGAILGGAAT